MCVLLQWTLLSIGSEVGLAYEEQINGIGELVKPHMQQIKLVVNVDGVDHSPWDLSGCQPLLGGQIGVIHHGGNPAGRSVPSWSAHTLDQPLPIAPDPRLRFWSYWGLLLQKYPLPRSCSLSSFFHFIGCSTTWFPRVLLWGSHLRPLLKAKSSSFGSNKVRIFVILKLVFASMEISHEFWGA